MCCHLTHHNPKNDTIWRENDAKWGENDVKMTQSATMPPLKYAGLIINEDIDKKTWENQ